MGYYNSCDRCGKGIDEKKYAVYLYIESKKYTKSIRHEVFLCDECAKEALEPIINGVENLSGGA